MKILSIVGAAALVAFGFAAQASAETFTFSPTGTAITVSGPTTLSADGLSVSCTSTFTGSTSSTGATGTITAATFTGSNTLCAKITAKNLPWTVTPTSATTVSIAEPEVQLVDGIITVTCGPGTLTNQAFSNSVLTLSGTLNPGSCTVSGTLTASPTVTIVSSGG